MDFLVLRDIFVSFGGLVMQLSGDPLYPLQQNLSFIRSFSFSQEIDNNLKCDESIWDLSYCPR